jgi:hypothetical protein
MHARETTSEENAFLSANVRYDLATGTFWWKKRGAGRRMNVPISGSRNPSGYHYVRIKMPSLKKQSYLAHRLAWFCTFGSWPKIIDHINGDKRDNRLSNLREATKSQNMANSRLFSTNRSGFKGVSFNATDRRWCAYIGVNGKRRNLGSFPSAEEAYAAYCVAALTEFKDFARLS